MNIIYGRKFGKLQPTRGSSHLALLSDTLLSPHKVCCLFSYPFHTFYPSRRIFLIKSQLPTLFSVHCVPDPVLGLLL